LQGKIASAFGQPGHVSVFGSKKNRSPSRMCISFGGRREVSITSMNASC
jgi:hypothetical protein